MPLRAAHHLLEQLDLHFTMGFGLMMDGNGCTSLHFALSKAIHSIVLSQLIEYCTVSEVFNTVNTSCEEQRDPVCVFIVVIGVSVIILLSSLSGTR